MDQFKKKYLIGLLPLLVIGIILFTPVMITMNGNKNISIEVYDSYKDPGATLKIKGKLKTEASVDTSHIGDYEITYSWLFEKATRKVHVVDTTAPQLTLLGPESIKVIQNTKYVDPGYLTKDNYDQNVKIEASSLDTTTLGKQEIQYTAKDQSGNTTTLTREVMIVEDDYHYLRNTCNQDDPLLLPIITFYNDYFRSMRYLTPYVSSIYTNDQAKKISETAFRYLIETRKLSINDLRMNDCCFDIESVQIEKQGNQYIVKTIVNEECNFNFMYETTSKIYGIEDTFVLEFVNQNYSITSVDHGEGFYTLFTKANGNLEDTYTKALRLIQERDSINQLERKEVNLGYNHELEAKIPYDRQKAVAYAKQYWHERNSDYSKYESNCMNFGSQVIHAGGIEMDHLGSAINTQWKNYSANYNEKEEANGLVYTWTFIPFFRDYLRNDPHIVSLMNENLYSAKPGDLIQISTTSLEEPVHNMVVVDTIHNAQDEILDILVNGNTLDMENWPLSASAYPYKSLVRIFGSN